MRDVLLRDGSDIVREHARRSFRQVIEKRLREIRQARRSVQDREVIGRLTDHWTGPNVSTPSARRSFAANLDPATLPAEVRQKLGWLLLDYLRVCSIGARLPWSGWARGYVGTGRQAPAPRTCCSRPKRLNPQHATFLNVTFGSSFDADDTHVGRHAASRRRGVVGRARDRRARRRLGARRAGRSRRGLRDHHPDRARDAARPFQARLPEHRHLRRDSAPRRPPAGCCSAARMPSRASSTRSGSPAATPAGSRNSIIRARPASASRPRTRRRAASRRRCSPSKASGGQATSSKAPAALPAPTPTDGTRRSSRASSASAFISWTCW